MTANKTNHPCPMCDAGHVDLYIAGEHVETITCPECHGTGKVTATESAKMHNSINAFNKAVADEQFKY